MIYLLIITAITTTSVMLFTHFVLSVAVSDTIICQDKRQFKNFEKKC